MMGYHALMTWHLATILPAFVIGTWLLFRRKGSTLHRTLGKAYMVLMVATALITLAMLAQVCPRLLGHFGLIHGFSLLTLYLCRLRCWLHAVAIFLRIVRKWAVHWWVGDCWRFCFHAGADA